MKLSSLEAIFAVLNEGRVRYLVAGGVAVNAHGYQRLTQDLDLVLGLEGENVLRAMAALKSLGYRPMLPVEPEEFADPARRRAWHQERNVEVFSMVSDAHRETPVDFFVRPPFDFEEEYPQAMVARMAPALNVPFVRLRTLIAMKDRAGRPLDRDDAQHLRWILEQESDDG